MGHTVRRTFASLTARFGMSASPSWVAPRVCVHGSFTAYSLDARAMEISTERRAVEPRYDDRPPRPAPPRSHATAPLMNYKRIISIACPLLLIAQTRSLTIQKRSFTMKFKRLTNWLAVLIGKLPLLFQFVTNNNYMMFIYCLNIDIE